MSFIHLGIFSLLLLPYFCQFQSHSRFCPIGHCSSFIICIRILQRNQTIRIYLCVSRCMCVCIKYTCICICFCVYMCYSMLSCFSHVQLCDCMDLSPPGSSVRGIFWARILEWVSIPSSRGPSGLRDRTSISCIFCNAGGFFFASASGDAPYIYICLYLYILPRWC